MRSRSSAARLDRAVVPILADVLDRPVAPLHAPDGAVARAMALLALQRHGVHHTRTLDHELVAIEHRYEPIRARRTSSTRRVKCNSRPRTPPFSRSARHSREFYLSLCHDPRCSPRAAVRGTIARRRSSPSSTGFAQSEDATWETGKCSGTMYCGDHEPLRVHGPRLRAVRARQRTPARHVPEHDEVRGRDHRDDARPAARRRDHRRPNPPGSSRRAAAAASCTRCSRTASTRSRRAASTARTSSSPRPRTPRSTRRVTCWASSCGGRRSIRRPRSSTSTRWRGSIDENTIAMIGSACNYGYGTDRSDRRRSPTSRSSAASACTSTVASAASSCRGVRSSATTSRCSTSACPGVTIDLGRHAQVRLRLQGLVGAGVPRQGAPQQPVLLHDRLDGRQVRVARHRRLAVRRPARGHVGGDGEHRARRLPGVRAPHLRDRVRDAGRGALASGAAHRRRNRRSASASRATTSTSTTSTTSCGREGWRFNGQQYPNGIHMAVTRPQTQPGVVETFAADLAEAVPYAHRAQGRESRERRDLRRRRRRHDRRGRRRSSDR